MSNENNYFKDIENTIKNYLREKNTDYGIMLTGEWGTGKTYYVKNYLGYIKEELKFNEPLYISVAGKSNVEEIINDLFLLKILGNSSNNKLNIIKTIANNGGKALLETLKAFKVNLINSVLSSIFNIGKDIYKEIDNFQNTLIVIDDLERLSKKINIEDLLYSIYDSFVSNNVKVLLICNEEVLINNEEYNKIKEKIIRHTIKLHSIDKNNFKLFLEIYIIKNLIDDKDIENYYISNNFFYKQCIPNIINIFMEMECYNIRTFKKFFDMSKYFFNEINRFIEEEEYKLRNNEELFLEILKIFAIVLIVYDKNIINNNVFISKEEYDKYHSEIITEIIIKNAIEKGSMKMKTEKNQNINNNINQEYFSKFKELISNIEKQYVIRNETKKYILYYFYKYIECGILNYKELFLEYKNHIYLNKKYLKSYKIISEGYENSEIIKENIDIVFNIIEKEIDNFMDSDCFDIYSKVYFYYYDIIDDNKYRYLEILKNALYNYWNKVDVNGIFLIKNEYEHNNFFHFLSRNDIISRNNNDVLINYERKLLNNLYEKKIKEVPEEFYNVLENFNNHNKYYFFSDFGQYNYAIVHLLFLSQNLKLIPKDVFSIRIFLFFLNSETIIYNAFQEYKIYDYNAKELKDMVNNLIPFLDSIVTYDKYLLNRVKELRERIRFYNNINYINSDI
ncbi:AAA family ATPase [Brachyspira intermedia]|uniref:P-loop NTPase fold protein n=1 Tax=Brachyspira intermedia TaxID=84377 RepID=UPI0030053EEB